MYDVQLAQSKSILNNLITKFVNYKFVSANKKFLIAIN